MNAITLIRRQHAELDLMLVAALATDPRGRGSSIHRLSDMFEAHTAIEEQLFYPAFTTRDTRGVLGTYVDDHRDIRRQLGALLRLTEVSTDAMTHLRNAIVSHVHEEEEARLLPLVAASATPEELERLGDEMVALYRDVTSHHRWRDVA